MEEAATSSLYDQIEPGPLAEDAPRDWVAENSRRAALEYVLHNVKTGMGIYLAVGLLVVIGLFGAVPATALSTWFACLLGAIVVRLTIRQWYDRDPGRLGVSQWIGLVWFGVILTTLVWGVGSVALLTTAIDPVESTFLLTFIICSMAAGSVLHLAPLRQVYRTLIIGLLLPLTVWMATLPLENSNIIALVLILFGAVGDYAARRFAESQRASIDSYLAGEASERRTRRLLDLIPYPVTARDQAGYTWMANAEAGRLLSGEPDRLLGLNLAELSLPDSLRDEIREADAEVFKSRMTSTQFETIPNLATGRRHEFRVTRSHFFDPITNEENVIVVKDDVTEERAAMRALAASESRFAAAFENAPIGMMVLDPQGKVVTANPAANEMFSVDEGFWSGKPLWHFADWDDAESLAEQFNRIADGVAPRFRHEACQHCASGQEIWCLTHVSRVDSGGDDDIFAIAQIQDVTESRQLADRLSYQATHDPLTELLNRREFEARLQQAIESVDMDQTEHALLYVDLDRFKVINDSCGHIAGDEVLCSVSQLIVQQVSRSDTVARLGGDEFAVLLWNCGRDRGTAVANDIRASVDAFTYERGGKVFRVGASIGVQTIDDSGLNPNEVLRAADEACYAAKAIGANRVWVFDQNDEELRRRRGEVDSLASINRALGTDRFELLAQPIFSAGGNLANTPYFEILLRLRQDDGSLCSPAVFLPAAERYGLAPDVDRWVVRTSLQKLAEDTARSSTCSINLSGQTLNSDGFFDYVRNAFAESGVAPSQVCFEITETAAVASMKSATDFIQQLRSLGCQIALDDFGAGFSSFGYLKELPVDILKIDGMFVRDMLTDRVSHSLLRAIIDVAGEMGVKTVAEFVETEPQLVELRNLGVDYLQGYLLGRPGPVDDLLNAH